MSEINESAHLLGTDARLVGVLSSPLDAGEQPLGVGVVILSSGLLHRVGAFRLHVDLARRLSSLGFSVLRIDQHGRGDSARNAGLSASETIQSEMDSVSGFFSDSYGVDKLILIGLCSGADDAVFLSVDNDNVVGMVLLDGFSERTWRYNIYRQLARWSNAARIWRAVRRRFSGPKWKPNGDRSLPDNAAPNMEAIRNFPSLDQARESFVNVVSRGGQALSVYTGGASDYYCYSGQLRECLALDGSEEYITEEFFPSAQHTYPIQAHRDALVTTVVDWMKRVYGRPTST